MGLASITFCQLMEELRPKTGNPLPNSVLYILFILCLPNFSNKLYHVTGEDRLSSQHKIRTADCCLGEHCVSSWSSYILKRVIPWHFLFIYFLLISFLPNVSNKSYHDTLENQLSAEHIFPRGSLF